MARYQPDHRGFAEMMNSPMVVRHTTSRGHAAADELRTIAPQKSGRYKESVRVEAGRDLLKGDRPAAFVVADTDYATALEVGSRTVRNPPRPLLKLLHHIGE